MLRESIDVSVPKFFARFKVRGAIENGEHFFRQFVFWFLLAAHARSPFAGLYINLAE